jgi:hypothetical protein
MQMQPLVVPTPGRGNLKIPFQDNKIQADLPETRRNRQPRWAGTDDDNTSGFCQ